MCPNCKSKDFRVLRPAREDMYHCECECGEKYIMWIGDGSWEMLGEYDTIAQMEKVVMAAVTEKD